MAYVLPNKVKVFVRKYQTTGANASVDSSGRPGRACPRGLRGEPEGLEAARPD